MSKPKVKCQILPLSFFLNKCVYLSEKWHWSSGSQLFLTCDAILTPYIDRDSSFCCLLYCLVNTEYTLLMFPDEVAVTCSHMTSAVNQSAVFFELMKVKYYSCLWFCVVVLNTKENQQTKLLHLSGVHIWMTGDHILGHDPKVERHCIKVGA